MKRFFFVPAYIVYVMLFFNLYSLWRFSTAFKLLIFLFTVLLGVVFRRRNVPFVDTSKPDGEIYLSPVQGTVKSVRQFVPLFDGREICHEIRISISIWDLKGLYLPTSGEVSYLKANRGRKISREADLVSFYGPLEDVAHTNLSLTSKHQNNSLLRFVDSPNSNRPNIWLKSGDRGRGAACFGYYPFGGTLFIYLPKNSDILVFESEKVVPGETVIASIQDQR